MEEFTLTKKYILVSADGLMEAFTLVAQNVSPKGNSVFVLQEKLTRGVVKAQTAEYAVTLTKGSFATALAAYGLVKGTTSEHISTPVTLPAVTVLFNGAVLQKGVTLRYKATSQRGAAK